VPGSFYNKTQGTPFFTPDPGRRGYTNSYSQDNTVRLSWQAAAKHKFTVADSMQNNCQCHLFIDNGTKSPEASTDLPTSG